MFAAKIVNKSSTGGEAKRGETKRGETGGEQDGRKFVDPGPPVPPVRDDGGLWGETGGKQVGRELAGFGSPVAAVRDDGGLWGETGGKQVGRELAGFGSPVPPVREVEGVVKQYDSHEHGRRSVRLKGWDYRSPGYYFVTMCTYQRVCLFEEREFEEVAANALCRVPEQEHARHVVLDEWVVMPNHVHVIFVFMAYAAQVDMSVAMGDFRNALAGSLGVVVGRYKAAVSTRINKLRGSKGAKVWQRGYYERIIRNEREWRATQRYTIDNPSRWAEDRENLDALLSRMTYHP